MIRARIDENLKADVERVFEKLGLSATDAITVFYQQIKLHRGLPFSVKIPNKMTRKAIDDVRKGINVVSAKNKKDLFDKLEI